MARRPDHLFHAGPIIRDLNVPEQELALKPAPLRRGWRIAPWVRQLYGPALAAWTIGLIAATSGVLHNKGARSDAPLPSLRDGTDPVLPLPDPALPVWAERFRGGYSAR